LLQCSIVTMVCHIVKITAMIAISVTYEGQRLAAIRASHGKVSLFAGLDQ
jgi:hypothetical protein